MSGDIEHAAQVLEMTRGQRRTGIGASRRADDHLRHVEVDIVLEQSVQEAAVPGDVVFTAAAEHEGAVEAPGEVGDRRPLRAPAGRARRRRTGGRRSPPPSHRRRSSTAGHGRSGLPAARPATLSDADRAKRRRVEPVMVVHLSVSGGRTIAVLHPTSIRESAYLDARGGSRPWAARISATARSQAATRSGPAGWLSKSGRHEARPARHGHQQAARLVEIDAGSVENERRHVVGFTLLFLGKRQMADPGAELSCRARGRIGRPGVAAAARGPPRERPPVRRRSWRRSSGCACPGRRGWRRDGRSHGPPPGRPLRRWRHIRRCRG